jgi:hypothetical protein
MRQGEQTGGDKNGREQGRTTCAQERTQPLEQIPSKEHFLTESSVDQNCADEQRQGGRISYHVVIRLIYCGSPQERHCDALQAQLERYSERDAGEERGGGMRGRLEAKGTQRGIRMTRPDKHENGGNDETEHTAGKDCQHRDDTEWPKLPQALGRVWRTCHGDLTPESTRRRREMVANDEPDPGGRVE